MKEDVLSSSRTGRRPKLVDNAKQFPKNDWSTNRFTKEKSSAGIF